MKVARKIWQKHRYSWPFMEERNSVRGDAVIHGPSQAVEEEKAGMQLFSAGGEEGHCTEPPADPGREITASADIRS